MTEWLLEEVTDARPALVEQARGLFREYHAWLGDVVCSARLAEEIDSLPRPYAPPGGRLLLAFTSCVEIAGVVGIRPFEGSACEIKRLYVRPEFRGMSLGRRLAEEALRAATEMGYSEARLTTLPDTMDRALRLYRSLGFEETTPFTDHSHVNDDVRILYMRRRLDLHR